MQAHEVMTTTVATVRVDTLLSGAIAIMEGRHVSGLPVVDGKDALVGMLTEGDLLKRVETGTAGRDGSTWCSGPGAAPATMCARTAGMSATS